MSVSSGEGRADFVVKTTAVARLNMWAGEVIAEAIEKRRQIDGEFMQYLSPYETRDTGIEVR